MYRSVLVHVDREASSQERIRLAVGLARHHDAALIGLAAGLPRLPVELYADGLGMVAAGNDFTDLDRKEMEAEFGRAAAQFREATKDSGLKTDWRSSFEFPSNALVDAANAADIIVTGCGDRTLLGDYRLASAGDVLMRCGRPVLVVPAGLGELNVRNVLIAWKNTREARRAVADALPLLKRASSVRLVHISEGNGGVQSAKDAQALLARHQIDASLEIQPRGNGMIEEQLIQVARRHESDLVVAGAYGHTRFREWILGGMTRGLLGNCQVPCLMSH
jgi:nucleotide-binding universal stress UspA family protein